MQQECFIFTNTTLFIVILLQEIFYSLKVDNPKFLYFFSFFVFFFVWLMDWFQFLFFCVILILLNILRKRLKLTFDTFNFVELIFVCLGFWNVTYSWEIRWRKSKYSFIWNEWFEKWNTKWWTLYHCVQTQSGVGPVCWMAPESLANQTYSKKSDVWTFGIVGLWILSIFISFHFTIWCDIFVLMSPFTSIIEKFVCLLICLFSLWNCCTMWTSQRQRCFWCWSENSVNLLRLMFQIFFLTYKQHILTMIWFFIWIQRWRIDTRNSFKLSSETCWVDANVLEETTSTTSCILSLFLVSLFHTNSTIWFFFSLIEMLIGFWNNLYNVGTIEIELLFLWQNGTLYVRVS